MADLKAAFRAAKEQRSSAAPTPAQIRAMKAAKLSQKQEGAQAKVSHPAGPSRPNTASPQQTSSKPAPQGLPADFFQSQAASKPPAASTASNIAPAAPVTGQKRPIAPAQQNPPSKTQGTTTGKAAPVPEGFFADKAADAKARGIKLPDKEDKEAEFQAFQRAIEQELQQAAEQEAQAVEEEVEDKEDQEEFAQWVRLQQIEEMRRKGRRQLDSSNGQGEQDLQNDELPGMEDAATVTAEMLGIRNTEATLARMEGIQLPKKRKLAETLAKLQAEPSDEDEDEGVDDDETELLNWRAKQV